MEKKTNTTNKFGKFKDKRDDIVYQTVKIGGQIWMAENLNTSYFRNGDEIPEARTEKDWNEAGKEKRPVWSYYNFDSEYGAKYGKLYNWFTINDKRGIAPEGWFVPKAGDWETLLTTIENENIKRGSVDFKIKSISGWEVRNGNNESGFNALPAGFYGEAAFDGFTSIGEATSALTCKFLSVFNSVKSPINRLA